MIIKKQNRTPQARGCATHVLSSSGQVVLRFGDVRDAIHAVEVVSEIQVGVGRRLEARCVSRKEVELVSSFLEAGRDMGRARP